MLAQSDGDLAVGIACVNRGGLYQHAAPLEPRPSARPRRGGPPPALRPKTATPPPPPDPPPPARPRRGGPPPAFRHKTATTRPSHHPRRGGFRTRPRPRTR